MKRLFAMLLFAVAAAHGRSALAVEPVALYAPATGQIVIDGPVPFIFVIDSAGGNLRSLSEYVRPLPPGGFPPGFVFDPSLLPFEIGWSVPPVAKLSTFDAGNAFVPGTPISDLTFRYANPNSDPVIKVGRVVFAPEPSSLTLAALGVLAIMRRRAG